ncbi:recombinase family protein [Defluviimonas sp. SAOS-178_SWC]|uniref:recombinase family protein n=1 Tax=Defluviimonas sp. SAOS-178_SWC TaxID=3121287 RepID=UPI003D80AC27
MSRVRRPRAGRSSPAASERLRSKLHHFSTGRESGGGSFSRGQIHKILTNPVYRGLTRHRDKTYPGTHPAIVDETTWNSVQVALQAASGRRRGVTAGASQGQGTVARAGVNPAASLLGKVRDETGDPLTPTHTQRNGRRHTAPGGTRPPTSRSPLASTP